MGMTFHSLIDCSIGIILLSFCCGLYILGNKVQSIRLFSFLTLFVSLWSMVIGIADLSISIDGKYTLILIKFSYLFAVTVVNIFILFSISYPNEETLNKKVYYLFIISSLIFVYIIFFTNLIVDGMMITDIKYYPKWNHGYLWFIFDIYFIILFLVGIKNIYIKFYKSNNSIVKKNLGFMLIIFIIGFIPPLITSLILPKLGIFNYDWTSPFSSLIWITIISYAITKHKLFNIKIIAIEIVIFGLWTFALLRTLLSENPYEFYTEFTILTISIILGVLLVRSMLNEIAQREKIEELTNSLNNVYKDINEYRMYIDDIKYYKGK